tara:strand:+ start:3339 stop:3449 length:111 start_codon:yes stop_codon:yes gene_type:complete
MRSLDPPAKLKLKNFIKFRTKKELLVYSKADNSPVK